MNGSSSKKLLVGVLAGLFIILTVSCKGSSTEELSEEQTTVIVQLKEAGTSEALEKEFKSYGLKEKKVLSRPLYIVLYTFNTEKTTNVALVKLLKQSPLVKEAELNSSVELRN